METPGEQLRAARETAGLSLRDMSKITNYSTSLLSQVERGRRTVNRGIVRAYEDATGTDVGDEMKRRALLAGIGLAAVAPATMSELLRDSYDSALMRDTDDWLERAESYGQQYMQVGADDLRKRLTADLLTLRGTMDNPQLWGVSARLLTVYGKTIKGAKAASEWYRIGAKAADRSELEPIRVWVRGRSALALAYEGAGLRTAETLAAQALAISDKPSLGRLNALVALAHVAGVRGDERTALKALEQADRVFQRAGSHEQVSDFAVPEWRYWTFVSMLLSRLGHDGAVEAQEAADRTRPATLPRFATHIELHRGLYLARQGAVSEGIDYGRAALDRLPPEKHSLSLKLMMSEIEATANGAASTV